MRRMNAPLTTPLHDAARTGDEETARKLLDAGRFIHHRRHGGKSSLHLAAERRHGNIVRMLLDAGADPSVNPKP